ncbi:MAG TPA: 3-keto-5-aminohexanoate cleavage protein [Alphaproteobacteria bacterium]|jgi:3-keto-5-aminohexanoate cleavage enzyme|nr:3-keto-5-aminohexanoate cleavage protein [Alphaproteobacteria bacterium]MDP6270889.1 3-keto-5-aminohexanoate cleavage protein [Alphaproteobacteria bacterium]MDP7427011.1 3-keto-5-aminohexanoate cleavage protein [Alphaproteobacteria bacterium]HJM50284.1 3-keto-5-aminohexanoate cleavage protein [Alphaproteobacteria bacterium]|tara:strand:- start:637 stop:1524 length:888 start_codon:yes stop_codon:yes gene_type:complete
MASDRTIITCALTGAQQGKAANPALPEQPDEIIAQGLEAWRAGAAILHLHARDENGKASGEPAIFRQITEGLREAGCDAILNLSTGGAVAGLSIEQRLAVVPELKPEIASFSVGGGSMLGRWDESAGEWINDRFVTLFSSHAELERVARLFKDNGTRPELEVYHSGMLNNIAALDARGVLQKPLLVNLVTGIPGECNPGTVRNLLYLVDHLPPGSCWLVAAIGARNHYRLLGAVVAMGGHVRVGLEDNLYLERGRLAASNGEIVEKAVRILHDLGGEPASPTDARQILELKGGQR